MYQPKITIKQLNKAKYYATEISCLGLGLKILKLLISISLILSPMGKCNRTCLFCERMYLST